MEKKVVRNERTGERYTYVKHPTGLDIFIWKMEDYSITHALFGTKYGSINTKFKTKDEPDFITVPNGIAHYLEHKLFENEDCDVFSLYAKTGASANAYTSFDKTCYLFSCTDNVYESLEILLSFVQDPYFTEETVRKEQGIIGQEIRMYDDDAGWRVFFNMLQGMYHNHPVKIDIAGTVESIAKINADLLYKCYRTFYNLNNMVLSIAGNVDEDKVLEMCDKLLKQGGNPELETAFEDEPETVLKKEVVQKLEIAMPMFNIGFKAKPETGIEALKAETETNFVLSLLAGESSDFYKKIYDEGLINSTFSSEVFSGDGYCCSIFGGESRNPRLVRDRLIEEIERRKKEGFDEEKFKNIKKAYYGALIRDLNDAEAIATNMLNAGMEKLSAFDAIETVAAVTFEDITKRLEKINTENVTISIIEPLNGKEEQN
ncbi:MAG: insulinase family protein [Ruminococcus sp.]|nr:insulinase family protein [Ruminococcus sp.]MCM1479630.1 insulinase family protein [Muribaculaceae bacterium]